MERLDTAVSNLLKNLEARRNEGKSSEGGANAERAEPAHKPLPLVDEEKLANIADPDQRERERRALLEFYERSPNVRESRERVSREVQAAREKEKNKIVTLPLWPEQTRGTPNSFLRGALFAAIQGKERHYLKAELLSCQQGIDIRFTGMQLDQSDLDVWEQAVTLAAKDHLGDYCSFKIKSFLRMLGRNNGKSDREWLKDSFRRLAACCVEITHNSHTYGGSPLEFLHDESSDTYQLHLNPRIICLYNAGWTAIDWDVRSRLRRKPLASWLHGWLSSNAENYPIKVETLRKLSGSKTKELFRFRQNLRVALDEIQEAGAIIGWSIDPKTDKVSFDRIPSPTQQRHVIKKGVKSLPSS